MKPNVADNMGLIELIIVNKYDKKSNIEIIYTTYEGVVICSNRRYYKNDNFERYILHLFQ